MDKTEWIICPGVSKQKVDRTTSAGVVDNLGTYLKENLVDEFDEELWYLTVDKVEVFEGGRLRVVFRDGATVDVPNEK